VPKITKIPKKQPKQVSIPVAENIVIEIERDGNVFRSYYQGKKVGEVSGTFLEWCFSVEDYNICFSKEELEAMLGEH